MVKDKDNAVSPSAKVKTLMNGSPIPSSPPTVKSEQFSASILNSERCYKLGATVNTKDLVKVSVKVNSSTNWFPEALSETKQSDLVKAVKDVEHEKSPCSRSPEKLQSSFLKPLNGSLKHVSHYSSSKWPDKLKTSTSPSPQKSPIKNESGLVHISRMKSQASMYRKMFGVFKEKCDVLARWSDGLYYLGTVCKVVDFEHRCLVQFEDKSESWVHFKDLQPISPRTDDDDDSLHDDTGSDVTCALCRDGKSEKPNEIVLCDKCGQGFHQLCHMPPIDTKVVKIEDETWQCRTCVFAAVARGGGADSAGPGAIALKMMKEVLPYDITSLTWDKGHKSNSEEIYCYCGGPGDWYLKMLQCCRCQQWFHEACIQCLDAPILYGDRFYLFVCSICNQGNEYIKRLPIRWVDIVHLVLYNITIAKKVKYYDYAALIIPFFAQNWDSLQLGDLAHEASTRSLLKDRVLETLQNNKTKFQTGSENKKGRLSWGLRTRSPPVPPTVTVPSTGLINDELLQSLDLRHGSLLLSESPTPLKRSGPGDVDPVEGSSPHKLLPKDPLEEWRHRTSKLNNSDSSTHRNTNNDNIFDRLYSMDDTSSKNNCDDTIRLSDQPKRRRGRPRKESFTGSAPPTPPPPRGRGRPISSIGKLKKKDLNKFKKGPSSFCSDNSTTIPISELFQDLPGAKNTEAYSGKDAYDKDLRDTMARYFGAEGRIACGERFNVLAKRVLTGVQCANGSEPRVEYLIEWEGYTAKQLSESVHKS